MLSEMVTMEQQQSLELKPSVVALNNGLIFGGGNNENDDNLQLTTNNGGATTISINGLHHSLAGPPPLVMPPPLIGGMDGGYGPPSYFANRFAAAAISSLGQLQMSNGSGASPNVSASVAALGIGNGAR